jgi:hypothetical protein
VLGEGLLWEDASHVGAPDHVQRQQPVRALQVRAGVAGAFVPRDVGGADSPPDVVSDTRRGFLPLYQRGSFEIFGPQQRDLTVKAIKGSAGGQLPQILCLQEVESLLALREFNDAISPVTIRMPWRSTAATSARSTWPC